jgi:hypothetical protein
LGRQESSSDLHRFWPYLQKLSLSRKEKGYSESFCIEMPSSCYKDSEGRAQMSHEKEKRARKISGIRAEKDIIALQLSRLAEAQCCADSLLQELHAGCYDGGVIQLQLWVSNLDAVFATDEVESVAAKLAGRGWLVQGVLLHTRLSMTFSIGG